MALKKTLYIDIKDTTLEYIRVSKCVRLSETERDAEFNFHGFTSVEASKKPRNQGEQVGVMRFITTAFDAYFSKAALAATDNDVYGQAYQAAKDWTAANKVRRAAEKIRDDARKAMTEANVALSVAQKAATPVAATVAAAQDTLKNAQAALAVAEGNISTSLTPAQTTLVLYGFVSGPFGESLFEDATDAQ